MARAVFVIADIGGYTRFMKVHRINLAHAQYVVAQLLESVIDAAGRRLKLAKLEGDAAFFYGVLADQPKEGELATFADTVHAIRAAFLSRRLELEMDRICSCEGCTKVGELKLKFVAHLGEVAFQKVKRYKELAGVDVITVHRLLKNSVPVPEYVLMSEPIYERATDHLRSFGKQATEDLEGLGEVTTYYVDLAEMTQAAPSARPPSRLRRIVAWLKLAIRSTPYLLGLRKACDGFRNVSHETSGAG
jgi:class 3 adenylate cyclase